MVNSSGSNGTATLLASGKKWTRRISDKGILSNIGLRDGERGEDKEIERDRKVKIELQESVIKGILSNWLRDGEREGDKEIERDWKK